MRKITLFFSWICFCFYFLASSTPIDATYLFYDDFSSGGVDKWTVVGGDFWKVVGEEKILYSELSYREQGYLLAKNTYNLSDYKMSVEVRNVSGIDQHFIFRAKEDLSAFYQVELRFPDPGWPQDPASNLRLWRYKDGGYVRLLPDMPYNLVKDKVHNLVIELNGFNIKIYVDGDLVIDFTDELDGISEGGVGIHAYAGDYRPASIVNYYDNFSVSDLESAPHNKIIVVPGFGGSWNTEALVYNRPVADDSWVMTPFVKNYDGLINTLIQEGYERDKDLFVWNYDWRKPVAENVVKFNSFVESKVAGTQKVDIVGHSMGGLIARIWAQDNLSNNKVGKVVTLGSPHSGLVKAYEWWNGGKAFSDNDAGSIALAILYQLNRRNLQSEVEVLRNYAPSLKDVLPTFDFVKKGSKLISGNDLYFKNDYLKGKNSSVSLIFDNLLTVAGIGQKTTGGLTLGERSVFDTVLNKWPDGSLLKYVHADGDGAVLKNSAVFSGDVYGEKLSDHGQITDKAINMVLSELGIGVSSTQPIYEMGKKAVFFIGSPAYLNVKCDGDSPVVSDQLGFVLTGNLGNCLVNVIGTDSGVYHLVTGTTYDDSWRYFEDSINVGETRVFLINNGKLKNDVVNLDSLYRLVGYDVTKLQSIYPNNANLSAIKTAVNTKQVSKLITALFNFRKEKQESLVSGAIIKNVETILAIENRNLSSTVVKSAYIKAVQSKSLVDRTTRLYSVKKVKPSIFGAESYGLLEKMMDQNGSDYAKSVLAVQIASEVWR